MILEKTGLDGDVKVLRVLANGKDISQAVTQVIINQSMFNHFWYAQLLINDTTNLKTLVPLTNGCEFKVTVETDIGSKFDSSETYSFMMQSIVNANQVNHMHTTYIINLVDRSVFLNMYNHISRAYQNERSDKVVRELCLEYLQAMIDTDGSDNGLTAIIPNLTPFEAISWISKSSTYNGGADYVFFQKDHNRFGYHSISKLYHASDSKSGLTFDRRPKNLSNLVDDNYDYSTNMMQISLTYPDAILDGMTGYYGSKVNLFDLTRKTYSTEYYKGNEDPNFDKRDKYHSTLDSSMNTVQKTIYRVADLADNGITVSEDFSKWVASRRVNLALPNRNMLLIQTTGVAGHGKLVGKTVEVRLPSQQDEKDDRDDILYSGRYLVTKVTQKINGTKFITNFELIKLEINKKNN